MHKPRLYPVTLICATVMLFTLTMCTDHPGSFSSYTPVDGVHGWAYTDTIAFLPQGLDSAGQQALSIGMRHTAKYPYRNIWLEVSYMQEGHTLRDTLGIELADKYGRWLGSGLGPTYQIECVLPHLVSISDSTPVYVRHIMRLDTLRGIEQIGITLRKQ